MSSFQVYTFFFHNINQNLWEIFDKIWEDIAMKDFITSANSSHFLFSICICILLAIIICKLTEQEITVDLSIQSNPEHMVINGNML